MRANLTIVDSTRACVNHRLGTNEVTLNTAAVSACVQRRVFEDFLKKVRKAIQFDGDDQEQLDASGVVTYQSLVASHVSQDALDAVEWMEEAEEALPGAVMLKDRHGTTSVKCAVFSWVCDLIQVRFPVLLFVCVHSMIASTPWQTMKSVQPTVYPCELSRVSRILSICTAVISQTASDLAPLISRPGHWLLLQSLTRTLVFKYKLPLRSHRPNLQ